ncbi:protein FAR1-RELATED SEQUENCE 5-like [Camellia sinensis]|uniref:protein FAR1-RELATED SEQUENCE 5-like n=1 Tax=Camellia sinensis TaxID=4442 RepID=UPI001035AC75|nr:protein FAR1-RELATED SEQUENCE 5-like [Camellia sinensis]
MEFNSKQSAYEFYNSYGGRVGFSIRKEYAHKSKTSEITSRTFVCSKEGLRKSDKRDFAVRTSRAETRTGCGALMSIKLIRQIGKYRVINFVETHNHPLVVSACAHMLPSQRKISTSQYIEIDLADDCGTPLRSSYELMGRELDTEEQITNIFWADATMIIDYGQFGDVVTFDTTYKINRESRPFVIFVGFNNHRETIVFGAALMYDETTDSFIWLFKKFLEAMSNKHSKTIFTDQDAAMAKAISYVMPNTYHRLCTWHMMQNAVKHMSGIFSGPGGVRSVLGKFIDEYEEEEEFFAAWNAMLDEFDVHDNSWLQSIFHLRKIWVRAYVRWTWSVGMKSTQLSESLNADLKEYLRSDYNLIQFFIHFERVLNEKRYKEYEAEYALSYKLPRIKVQVLMLTQAGDVYTKTIFEEFQDEYVGSLELYVANCVHKDDCLVCIVKAYRQSTMREVKKDKDGNLSCSCRLFEMKGILCSQVIKVFKDEMIIIEIPSQYILKRWTKLARAEIVQDYKGRDIQADPKLEQSSRYKSLCSLFTMISSQASELEKTYEDCVQEGKKLLAFVQNKLRIRITNGPLNLNDASSTMRMNEGSENVIQAKGLKKRIDPICGR